MDVIVLKGFEGLGSWSSLGEEGSSNVASHLYIPCAIFSCQIVCPSRLNLPFEDARKLTLKYGMDLHTSRSTVIEGSFKLPLPGGLPISGFPFIPPARLIFRATRVGREEPPRTTAPSYFGSKVVKMLLPARQLRVTLRKK